MRLKEKANNLRIKPVNRAAVVNAANTKLKDTPFYHLLLVIAEGCDVNANDGSFYCTVGSIKDGTSLQFSIKLDGEGQVVYAPTLIGLAEACAEVHDPA